MSSSSSSRTPRRRFCAALAAWPIAGLARGGAESPIAGLQRWGTGEFRRFGFLVYEATLWATGSDPLRPPLALGLTYRRSIAGKAIAEASVAEMRRFVGDEARLRDWGERLARLFPDVQRGDRIVGLHLPDRARFFFNDRELGAIDGAEFAAAFFAIWLDARTSAPELRAALLTRPAE